MKISYQWLEQFLDIPTSPEETADLLTFGGLEVEKLERIAALPGGLKGIVVGEVKTCVKHPNADKLSLCTVDLGGEAPVQIVCGAPNVGPDKKVVVATVGSTIHPKEGDPFTIKKAKMRGETSEGMICAEDEIGLGESHAGVMILDADAKPGTPAADYFGLEEQVVIEIGLTPNRADGAAHLGVARDLLAILKTQGKVSPDTELKMPSLDGFQVDNHDRVIKVTVEDEEACPRYAGLSISGVEVKESPEWLKTRLESIGVRPINNVVDVTNYVLHELGQPLHAFDADKVKDDHVVVKKQPEGTPFTTLDEVERKLSSEDLMICNAEDGMCIAGVFGGMTSGITEESTNVFLESAYFNPVSVRKTAKRHGLSTDASFRFERGIDPNITVYALKRAALLIQEVAGGTITSPISDTHPEPFAPFSVSLDYPRADALIGKSIDRDTIKNILRWLEIEIEAETENGLDLLVPPFKVDVQREVDIIEEILRVYGYNAIEFPPKLAFTPSHWPKPDREEVRNLVCNQLTSQGFTEIMSNSLTREDYYTADTPWKDSDGVSILNPLSSDLGVMRQTLLYNGLETVAWNQNRQRDDLKLYEFGNVYRKTENGYRENQRLSILITGRQQPESWNTTEETADMYAMKGSVYALFARLGIDRAGVQTEVIEEAPFQFGLKIKITNKEVGRSGVVHSDVLKQFDIRNAVFVTDIDWDAVLKLLKINKVAYSEIPRFPEVRRDLALLVDQSLEFESIRSIARRTEKKLLQSINLFDVYEGKNLPAGKKSYAVSFTFQDPEKTLTDKQVDKVMGKLQNSLERQLGATVR